MEYCQMFSRRRLLLLLVLLALLTSGCNVALARFYNNRGLRLYRQQHYELALNDFNMAIRLNPRFAEASTGDWFIRTGQLRSGVAVPSGRSSWIPGCQRRSIAWVLPALVRPIMQCARAITGRWHSEHGYHGRGRVYFKLGKFKRRLRR